MTENSRLQACDQVVLTRVPQQMREELIDVARADDRSLAAVARTALREYLDRRPKP